MAGGLVKSKFWVYTLSMGKLLAIAGILGVVSVLPVWRGAGHSRKEGITFWKLLYDSTNLTPDSPFGHPHLPYDEAVQRAKEAWQEVQHGA